MMDQPKQNAAYYRQRAADEQAAAERAGDERARQTHIDLASRYLEAAERSEADAQGGGNWPPEDGAVLPKDLRIIR